MTREVNVLRKRLPRPRAFAVIYDRLNEIDKHRLILMLKSGANKILNKPVGYSKWSEIHVPITT